MWRHNSTKSWEKAYLTLILEPERKALLTRYLFLPWRLILCCVLNEPHYCCKTVESVVWIGSLYNTWETYSKYKFFCNIICISRDILLAVISLILKSSWKFIVHFKILRNIKLYKSYVKRFKNVFYKQSTNLTEGKKYKK